MTRTLDSMNQHLVEKEWLIGPRCTFVDLTFLHWDSTLDVCFQGGQMSSKASRQARWPHWTRWRRDVLSFVVSGCTVRDVLKKQFERYGT